jgi:tetratricopeptide (TPR) repeat protein
MGAESRNEDQLGRATSNSASAGTIGHLVQSGVIAGGVHVHVGGVPQKAHVPQQLPLVSGVFVGRDREMTALNRALDDSVAGQGGAVMVTALAGAGGIGKTALALHWARHHLDRFPDGQLFVDLLGFSADGQPMPTGAAVRGFLDAFGVDLARIPADPHAQVARYRSLVAGKRMLVVLDNAASTSQVMPLLPGSSTCMVIVTSRNHLTGLIAAQGARHVLVDALADVEARALLSTRLGANRVNAEPIAVDKLVTACGGFPLPLSLVAGRVLVDPQLTLTTLAAELRDATPGAMTSDDPTASLPAVLSWSYQALTPVQAQLIGLLATAPGPDISLSAAASLTGLSSTQTRTVLRTLEQSSLLLHDAPNRWRLHDLIRQYSADRARHDQPKDTRELAMRRLLDFYTYTAVSCDRLIAPSSTLSEIGSATPDCVPEEPHDISTALSWFDAEHRCLLAAQKLALKLRWHTTTWRLAWALTKFHWQRGHLHDDVATWQSGLSAAEALSNPSLQLLAHRRLGDACARVGQHNEAREHLQQALTLAEEAGDLSEQAHTHRILARAWSSRGDGARALHHAAQALELCRSLGNPIWEARALNQAGWYAALQRNFAQARDNCESALTLYRSCPGTQYGEANTLDSLGYIAHHTGRHNEAVDYYRRSIRLFQNIGHTYLEADVLERLGQCCISIGQRKQADTAWRQALELFRAQGRLADAERVQRQLAADDG